MHSKNAIINNSNICKNEEIIEKQKKYSKEFLDLPKITFDPFDFIDSAQSDNNLLKTGEKILYIKRRRSGSLADITQKFPSTNSFSFNNPTLLKIYEAEEEHNLNRSKSAQPVCLENFDRKNSFNENNRYLITTSMNNLNAQKQHLHINSCVSLPFSSSKTVMWDNKNGEILRKKKFEKNEKILHETLIQNEKANKYRRNTLSEINNPKSDNKKNIRKGSLVELPYQKSLLHTSISVHDLSQKASKKKKKIIQKKSLDKSFPAQNTESIEKDEGNTRKTLKFWRSRMSFTGLVDSNKLLTRRYSTSPAYFSGLYNLICLKS